MTDTSIPTALDAATVAEYLRQHPEFFVDQDELIPELRIPHQRGTSVSLVERQVKLLRERNIEMRHRLTELMDVARDNDRLFEKTRRLVLDLLDAGSIEEVVSAVEDNLRHEFKVPFVSFILYSESPTSVGRSVAQTEAQQAIGNLLASSKPICGALRPHELEFLFGEQGKQVGSTALVTLKQHGLIAVGSSDPQHYKSTVGTLFLNYIAEVLLRVLPGFSTPLRSVR
ncbi:DUF484 family protein [Pseudomonas matsuisoli]|uniref:DUF484 domain-containing protein n=1 Tax=Pseudomonas matsuisoli TaxID=1515666 RepID=A0A917Q0Q8_9PSED|nr:DUF484 family protein [Pseudomonas matsuisoli]GGK03691.1 hypothetical protein GCM10009304_32040 [Pseudomonas matsuisoli]